MSLHYVVRVETLLRLPNGDIARRSKSTVPAATADDCKTFASTINRSNRPGDTTTRQATPCVQVNVMTASYVIPLEELRDTVEALAKALDEHDHRLTRIEDKPSLHV